jgi:hypothetical protein
MEGQKHLFGIGSIKTGAVVPYVIDGYPALLSARELNPGFWCLRSEFPCIADKVRQDDLSEPRVDRRLHVETVHKRVRMATARAKEQQMSFNRRKPESSQSSPACLIRSFSLTGSGATFMGTRPRSMLLAVRENRYWDRRAYSLYCVLYITISLSRNRALV